MIYVLNRPDAERRCRTPRIDTSVVSSAGGEDDDEEDGGGGGGGGGEERCIVGSQQSLAPFRG